MAVVYFFQPSGSQCDYNISAKIAHTQQNQPHALKVYKSDIKPAAGGGGVCFYKSQREQNHR